MLNECYLKAMRVRYAASFSPQYALDGFNKSITQNAMDSTNFRNSGRIIIPIIPFLLIYRKLNGAIFE